MSFGAEPEFNLQILTNCLCVSFGSVGVDKQLERLAQVPRDLNSELKDQYQ